MALSRKHRWKKVGDNAFANEAAQISKQPDGKYILRLDLRAKRENQILLGPFDTSDAAEEMYETMMHAVRSVKTGDWSKGAGGYDYSASVSVGADGDEGVRSQPVRGDAVRSDP